MIPEGHDQGGKTPKEEVRLEPTKLGGGGPKNNIGPGDEDDLFIFFKKYLGLILAITSLPLITSALNILQPPTGNRETEAMLSGLSSIACLVVFSVSVLFRNVIAECAFHHLRRIRIIPPVAALLLVALGLTLAVRYVTEPPPKTPVKTPAIETAELEKAAAETAKRPEAEPRKGAEPADLALYFSIMPCFIFALGITLMGAYHQFRGYDLQNRIDLALRRPEDQRTVRQFIQNYAEINAAQVGVENPSLARRLFEDLNRRLSEVYSGEIHSGGVEDIIETKRVLHQELPEAFMAVSLRDMNFWKQLVARHRTSDGEGRFAKEYLKLECDHKKVPRASSGYSSSLRPIWTSMRNRCSRS